MLKRNEKQIKIFSGTLEELVPQDHFLRKVDKLVDFDFIYEKVAPYYCENNGRPSADPVMLMKILLLGYLYGIDSERKLEETVNYRVDFKWFCGLDLDEKAPDHCIFSANRKRRFGDNKIIEEIFNEIVRQCIELNLVDGKLLMTDSTHIRANVYHENQEKIFVTETPSAYIQKLDKEAFETGLTDELPEYISEMITDEKELAELKEVDEKDEAATKEKKKNCKNRSGKVRKKNTKKVIRNGKEIGVKKVAKNLTDPDCGLLFRKGKPHIFGYLSHETVDAKNGIIVGVTTTPANVTDNTVHNDLVIKSIETFHFDTEAIAADSGYDSAEIYAEFYRRGIKTFIVPQKEKNVFELVDFSYDELADMYTCPGGRQFNYRNYNKTNREKIYRAKCSCDNCPRKNECAAQGLKALRLSLHERERKAQRALFGTQECTEALQLRQVLCEGNFSRQKESHNLTRTRKRGLARVYEQCLLSSCALNLKRMVKCLGSAHFWRVICFIFALNTPFSSTAA